MSSYRKGPRLDPQAHGLVGVGVKFVTGYLVGTLARFNNAKRAEVADRVQHAGLEKGHE